VAKLSARELALDALTAWRRKKQFADAIIADRLASTGLTARDRAFALELFYGVLRNLSCLDFWIDCLRKGRLDAGVRDVLRLGLYQLLSLSIAEHAAIYETVKIERKRWRPVVNAVLRSALRRKAELLEKIASQPLSIRASHPQFLVERWERQFGLADTGTLCGWNNRPPPIYARVNKLKTGLDSFLGKHSNAQKATKFQNFARFDSPPIDALKRGECYVQDPSTAIACELLDPKPDERVLDACAAPGGKTGYLAEMMQNRGLIVACDRDEERIRLMEENLDRLGITNTNVLRHDWTEQRLPAGIRDHAPFDRILIDAPCTNTGVMRRRVDVRWRLGPADFDRMRKQQIAIAGRTEELLKPGGIMVYTTCSLEAEENDGVVQHQLKTMRQLSLEKQTDCLPFRDGFDGAFAAKLVKTADAVSTGCI